MIMQNADKAVELLQSCDLRVTKPRVAVLSALLNADGPLSQEQIADSLGDQSPNKTTIYRSLISLVEKDLVHEAYLNDRTQHYEPAHHCSEHQCHPHFTCLQCQKTHCLHTTQAPIVRGLPAGFKITRQQIRLEGLCDRCRLNSKKEEI